MMKRLLACAAWGAVALAPVAAGAVPTTVITQGVAPVQIQSCSALIAASTSTPHSQPSSASRGPVAVMNGTRIVSYGYYSADNGYTDSNVTAGSITGGTRVYATAQSVNHSGKTVSGIVYQFNVLQPRGNNPAAVFYGGRTGSFAQNIVISPPGLGASSPWSTGVVDSRVGPVQCFVAYVRFSDGTDWMSPLAVTTK